jgi:hypothetical protein
LDSRSELIELVRVGSLELISLLSANPADPLVAFALCTDDAVSALMPIGCTASSVSASPFPDLRFMPCEWLETGHREPAAFQIVVDAFHQRPADGWGPASDADFQVLVEGLAAARATGDVDDRVFLTVLAMDPSSHMEEMEEVALPLLNSQLLIREWRQWRLGEARSHLLSLRARPAPLTYAVQDSIERLQLEVQRFEALLRS